MDFGGRYLFTASRDRVWTALNDAEMLRAAIPGCEKLVWTSDTGLEAAIAVNLGVTKPRFTGDLTLSNVIPAQSYTLNGRGRGGLLGLAHGAADITLADHPDGCVLEFNARGAASNTIMKLGRSLIGKSAQRVIDGFFERFADAMDTVVVPLAD